MRTNLHTHSTFCDGKDTPEDIVMQAIKEGFHSIGFSGHCTTPYDLRYCMKDMQGYRKEIQRLQALYKNKIAIYLGVEEDAFAPVNRNQFQYIIGSCHYINTGKRILPVDSNMDYFRECLQDFQGDAQKLCECYYRTFCDYIRFRKPDIIGHFDLITKREETDTKLFLHDPGYRKLSQKYLSVALQENLLFEVNTGAMARNLRASPYPSEELLYTIQKEKGRIILSSDAHSKEALHYAFDETILFLKDIGFHTAYYFNGKTFLPYAL